MKKIVVLTGAGMSAESGFSTFRDSGGLWEKYPVEKVASHTGWLADPDLVTQFYNDRRRQLKTAEPNQGHKLLAKMQDKFDIQIITQNVDNLHEKAGSKDVIHLHGELTKVTSSRDPENPRFIKELTEDEYEILPGTKAEDGSLLRPYIVFFEEPVPMINRAANIVGKADIFVIIGTSMVVYPAAGLIHYTVPNIPIYLIDPKDIEIPYGFNVTHIKKGASEGIAELKDLLETKILTYAKN